MATEPGGAADLVGGGASKVGVSAAMRARDVSRPGPTQVEQAERTVRVSRRPLPGPPPPAPQRPGPEVAVATPGAPQPKDQDGSAGGVPDRS